MLMPLQVNSHRTQTTAPLTLQPAAGLMDYFDPLTSIHLGIHFYKSCAYVDETKHAHSIGLR